MRHPCVFRCLGLLLKGVAEDAINRSLRVGGCMNDKSVIFSQRGDPVLDISSGVAFGALVGDPSDGAKKGRAHLCYQFLFAVKLIPEAVAKGAMKAPFVPCAVRLMPTSA